MKRILVSLVWIMCLQCAASADTLYLKNGSVLKGTFLGFENGVFTMEDTDGNHLTYAASRVSKLVIDREPTQGESRTDRRRRRDSSNLPASTEAGGGRWEAAAPFNISLADQWVRSQIQVSKGQRVRVEASGTLTLGNRTGVGPDGVRNQRDADAPMPNENAGALIAAIGQDFDSPLILIGSSREFVADRDGVLYFAVNNWQAGNSSGAYRVNVSVDRSTAYSTSSGTGTPTQQTQGREKTVTVAGNQAWTDTGIDVEPNMAIAIAAEGEITISANRRTGPEGDRNANVSTSTYPIQSQGVGALIAKIRYRDGRDSNFLFIGSQNQANTESNEYGRLFIGINDDYFRDNSGSYRVTIRW